jgi:two-component system response regulator
MLRIMLVDDSPADAHILQAALNRLDTATEVIVLDDGIKAIEYLTRNPRDSRPPCDVVVLDLNLPLLNGVEILERIRRFDNFNSLPVIVMSGSTDPADVDRCYRAGANSYVRKRSHLNEILAMATAFVAYWSSCVQLPSHCGAGERVRIAS